MPYKNHFNQTEKCAKSKIRFSPFCKINSQNIFYIYVFSRHFYPKRLTVHSGYTFFLFNFFHHYVCSLGIEPTTFCAANAMLYHWATGTNFKFVLKKLYQRHCPGTFCILATNPDLALCLAFPNMWPTLAWLPIHQARGTDSSRPNRQKNTSPVRAELRTDILSEHHAAVQLTYYWVALGTLESICVTPGKHTQTDWGLNLSLLVTHTHTHTLHITFQAGLHIKSAHFIFSGREEFCASPRQHGSASDMFVRCTEDIINGEHGLVLEHVHRRTFISTTRQRQSLFKERNGERKKKTNILNM